MAKCNKCSKTITKKAPGLQCTKCELWLHATCSGVSREQLAALRETDSIDWKCPDCVGKKKPKRNSVIMGATDDSDTSDIELEQGQPKLKEVLGQIRKEVNVIIREELQSTLSDFSDLIDDFNAKITAFQGKIKHLENTNQNLILRNEALEQRINILEQNQLRNDLEIHGLPEQENEKPREIANVVCAKLRQPAEDVVKVFRKKKNQKSKDSLSLTLCVTLREGCRDAWLQAAKQSSLTAKDCGYSGENKVYIREALTPTSSYLLWKTKEELKRPGLYKFVWSSQGRILVRMDENQSSRTSVVRSQNDIEKLAQDAKNAVKTRSYK